MEKRLTKKEDLMQPRKRSFTLSGLMVMAFLVMLILTACATTSFDKTSFDALTIAKTTYDQSLQAMGDLQKQGKLTDAQVQSILKVADIYYVALKAAVSAWQVYHNNPSAANSDQLTALMNDAAAKLAQLLPVLSQYSVTPPVLTVPKK
jgi:hypothetical protein